MAVQFKACAVEACKGNAHYAAGGANGWCRAHYRRHHRYDDPTAGAERHVRQTLVCTVPGCGRPPKARSLCERHYGRAVSHGDPLGAGIARGEPLRWLKAHRAHAGEGCLIWPFSNYPDGYGQVRHRGRSTNASRVMCIEAYGEPPTVEHESAHTCGQGRKGCVHPQHLRWDTPKGNCADRVAHGTENRGERQGRHKLTEDGVRQIRSMRGSLSQSQIGDIFGVSRMTISDVFAGRTWGWLT